MTRKSAVKALIVVLAVSFWLAIMWDHLPTPNKQIESVMAPAPFAEHQLVDDAMLRDMCIGRRSPNARKTFKTMNGTEALGAEDSDETGIVSDRFVLRWNLDGTDLWLSIDTDLPDTADVIVTVDRIYYEVGNTDAYSRHYFEGKGPMSKWRTPCRVPINNTRWKENLRAFQAEMARISSELAFVVDRIEDQIGVRAVVHLNQSDPRFGGPGNPNLTGAAVSRIGTKNSKIIEDQQEIELPLTGVRSAKEAKNVPYDGLMKGESYRLLTKTSLMAASPKSVPNSNFEETMEAIGKTLYIPAGRIVRVISIDKSSRLNPWYEVEVIGNERATGWINSTALMRIGVVRE